MDFESLKKKALELKEKASEKIDDVIDYWAKKIAEKSIDEKMELEDFIEKSVETSFTSKETWETKTFKHKVVVIFWEENSDFFKDALLNLPVLKTKAFSSSIKLKLAKSKIEWVNLTDYNVEEIPSMVVFQDKKVYKVIEWEKNIEKITKSFTMDLEKEIENF